jgi:SRSO17 transposase
MAYEQVQEAVRAGLAVKVVVADSWFDSADLMKKITALGLTFIVEIKSNRRAKQNPGLHAKWSSLNEIFSVGSRKRLYSRLDSQKVRKRF